MCDCGSDPFSSLHTVCLGDRSTHKCSSPVCKGSVYFHCAFGSYSSSEETEKWRSPGDRRAGPEEMEIRRSPVWSGFDLVL